MYRRVPRKATEATERDVADDRRLMAQVEAAHVREAAERNLAEGRGIRAEGDEELEPSFDFARVQIVSVPQSGRTQTAGGLGRRPAQAPLPAGRGLVGELVPSRL